MIKTGIPKQIRFDGHNYEFWPKCITIDNADSIQTYAGVVCLLDNVVTKLGLTSFVSGNVDTVYYHIHANHDKFTFGFIARHVYDLMYRNTEEYQVKERLRIALMEHPEYLMSAYVSDTLISTFNGNKQGIANKIADFIDKVSDSANFTITITRDLPF